ncbi:DUF4157 domain-containing protein [Variovorax humicola]|uniref:DUF4157 domain-containing protein n=1 Tax=Variovorax humicola TaxID=1769758 RepID=A0ABU8VWZ0_9BURK
MNPRMASQSQQQRKKPAAIARLVPDRRAAGAGATNAAVQPLETATRGFMEQRFGHDFANVRIHTDEAAAQAALSLGAEAFTTGRDISFAPRRYAPGSPAGRELIAHELAHVVQQRHGAAGASTPGGETHLEAQANHAATAAMRSSAMPPIGAAAQSIQRRVPLRDVGKGEFSGMPRLGELIDRLNGMSTGLTYANDNGVLTVTPIAEGTPSEFDRQMQAFIDDPANIPMRFTNRHGLIGDKGHGYHDPVDVDTWMSGYVDIDDLLASSDLGLQTSLVHLLRERGQTKNYDRRIGTESLDASQEGPAKEFARAHASGIDAELKVLRDFFGDPSIVIVDADSRRFRNDRRDVIREKETRGRGAEGQGLLAIDWEVVLHKGRRVVSAVEYKRMRDAERAAAADAAAPAP